MAVRRSYRLAAPALGSVGRAIVAERVRPARDVCTNTSAAVSGPWLATDCPPRAMKGREKAMDGREKTLEKAVKGQRQAVKGQQPAAEKGGRPGKGGDRRRKGRRQAKGRGLRAPEQIECDTVTNELRFWCSGSLHMSLR